MTRAIQFIAVERQRQIDEERFTPERDRDVYDGGELAIAGACYAMEAAQQLSPYDGLGHDTTPPDWPWDPAWWKPKNPLRDLMRAGALIAAELDRMLIAIDDLPTDMRAAVCAERDRLLGMAATPAGEQLLGDQLQHADDRARALKAKLTALANRWNEGLASGVVDAQAVIATSVRQQCALELLAAIVPPPTSSPGEIVIDREIGEFVVGVGVLQPGTDMRIEAGAPLCTCAIERGDSDYLPCPVHGGV